jgi:hypothetical protein
MTDDRTAAARSSSVMFPQLALSVALIAAVGGLIYMANVDRQSEVAALSHTVITGELQVSYMLITSKTASSEQAIGSTISASRVQYCPAYVLVTTENDMTVLWAVDRLKKLEVTRIEPDTTRQSK